MTDEGLSEAEIGWRLRRSPGHVQHMLTWMELRAGRPYRPRSAGQPSPIERTVLRSRADGVSHAEIASRLRRTPGFIERVERFAALRSANA